MSRTATEAQSGPQEDEHAFPSDSGGRDALSQASGLSARTLVLYGAPSFAGAAMLVPILVHMPKFYSDVVRVPLGYLAIAIAVARAVDALGDPFFGWLSDRRTRFGRRRPYILLWSPPCAVAFWLLFHPPEGLSPELGALWFGTMFILYSLFHTAYALPYWALGAELTLDYHERSRLFGVREGFSILGTIVASIAPGLLMNHFALAERAAFSVMGWTFSLLLVATCLTLVWSVQERRDFLARSANPFAPGVRRALRNRPFRILLCSYVVSSITGAIPGTLMPYFNAYVLQPANEALWLSIFLGVYFASAFLCLPAWVAAAHRFGKRNAWLASFFLGITGGVGMFFLRQGDLWPAVLLIAWAGAGFGAGLFLGPAMQADVIDYDELYTGKRREAQYSAFWSVLPKFVAIPSAAIPIAILGSLGYVPNQPQTPAVVFAIQGMFALAPAASALLAFMIALRFPIDEAAHRAILKGIELHREGRAARDPLTGQVVPPPHGQQPDEDTRWFLDHFSARELRKFANGDASFPLRSAARSAGLALLFAGAVLWMTLTQMRDVESDPGVWTVLGIVTSGFSLAVAAFHFSRISAARQLAKQASLLETQVQLHLKGH